MPQTNPWLVFLRHGYTSGGSRTKTNNYPYWVTFMSQKGYRKNDAKYACLGSNTTRGNVKGMNPQNRKSFLSRCFNAGKRTPMRSRASTPGSYRARTPDVGSRASTPGLYRARTPDVRSRASTPGLYRARTPDVRPRAVTPGSTPVTRRAPSQTPTIPPRKAPVRPSRKGIPTNVRQPSARIRKQQRAKRQEAAARR